MNVIIIHGAHGSPEENWFPWLKTELEKKGQNVFVPKFPTPDGQYLKNWLMLFDDYRKHINENTVFVGHSLGPAFILSILETLRKPVKACFFVAGFARPLNNPQFDRINKTFVQKQFNWQAIRLNCGKFSVYASDNDPYVPIHHSKELSRKLKTGLIRINKAGHFNTAAGYNQFQLLLEDILKECA